MTQQIQKKEQMGKEEDWNGLQLRFLKTSKPSGFSKAIFVIFHVWYNALSEIFVWYETVILLLTSNFLANVTFLSE